MRRAAKMLGLTLILAGCKGNEHGVVQVTNTDTWQQAPTNQVDILFVIDDSHSMTEEQASVANGFESFIGQIESTGTDFQIGIVTTSFLYDDPDRGKLIGDPPVITNDTPDYRSVFTDRVTVGILGSDKEKGLEVAQYATSTVMTTGANAGFMRPDAYLLIVIVSDEEDCSDAGALEGQPATACYDERDALTPTLEFVSYFKALKEDPSYVQFGAIVGPLIDDPESCEDATPGRRYIDVADQMGGLVGNICGQDYGDIMQRLGLTATGVVSSFELSDAADVDTIEVTVGDSDGNNGVIVPQATETVRPTEGWLYNADTHFLTFYGTSIPPRGATITATYTVMVGG
jgi:hypothetical protein